MWKTWVVSSPWSFICSSLCLWRTSANVSLRGLCLTFSASGIGRSSNQPHFQGSWMSHGTFIPSRSTWISPCHWTSIRPVSQTPAAQPALQERTLCFPMIPSRMNRVSPNTHLSFPMADSKGADTVASMWHLRALCAYKCNVRVLMSERTCVCVCVCMYASTSLPAGLVVEGHLESCQSPLAIVFMNCEDFILNHRTFHHLIIKPPLLQSLDIWERQLKEMCAGVIPHGLKPSYLPPPFWPVPKQNKETQRLICSWHHAVTSLKRTLGRIYIPWRRGAFLSFLFLTCKPKEPPLGNSVS